MNSRITRILLLIICVIVIVPQSVHAETFNPANTDVSIELDSSRWYTFSPENIEGNEELTYLGIDHQQMAQYMEEQSIHLYNIIYFGDYEHYMELLLKKTVNEDINNINNFDRKEVLEIAKTIAKERGLTEYVMYEDSNKYIVFDYEEEGLYCKDYVTIINGCNYTITVRNPAPFIDNDMGIIENVIKTVTFKIDPTKAAEVEEEKELPKLSLGAIITFVVLIAVLVCAVLTFVKWKKKIRFENEMNELYETISANSRNVVFLGGKKEFYFVGRMLNQLFPNSDLKNLFTKYVNLYKTYAMYDSNVYKTVNYAKENFKELDVEESYTLLSLVMLNVDGIKRFADCNTERIEPFRKKAKDIIKCVAIISNNKETFATRENEIVGTRENPILLSGIDDIKEYLSSVVAEDGTRLDYIHKSIVYIKDKKLDIEYDLRKYTLIDADTGVEIRDIWFNSYGRDYYSKCIDGFAFESHVDKKVIELLKNNVKDGIYSIKKPEGLKISNVALSGNPKLDWESVEYADRYFIYRSTKKNGVYTYQGSTVDTTYVDSNTEAGLFYYYRIKAVDTVNSVAVSELSNICCRVCDLKQPILKASLKEGKPMISWNAVQGASKYEIYRKIGKAGTYDKYFTTVNASFINVLAEVGKTYYYKVIAVCPAGSQGNSAYSNEVYITAEV